MSLLHWTHQQFEQMSWHDNHLHALRIIEGRHGAGELLLDIDYILEWVRGEQGMRFRIVPATLRFLDVTGLRIALDYATPSAALGPFSIHAIERCDEQRERHVAQVWKIVVNWPVGDITFEASGYEQVARAEPVLSELQHLTPGERDS